jgi:nitrate reductase gamma subunit
MTMIYPLLAVIALILIAWIGAGVLGLHYLFGVVVPYAAILTFFIGLTYRIVLWGKSAVPFRIPTTGGQQKSFRWIKSNPIDNPSNGLGVIIRMAFEILTFRSLFRNTRMELRTGPKISYASAKWLWIGALLFHYSFLVILIRHIRFFTVPVPFYINIAENLDGFFQLGVPGVFITDAVILVALGYLFLRRAVVPQMRYLSLSADYFPLFLIGGLAISGILMRYFIRTDIEGVKELTMGLVTFHPTVPDTIGAIFFIHLFMISILLAYFPFSKLMHLGGVFLSPTRNLPNDNRFRHHGNPWNYPVKVHTYDEYEDDFREKMIEAGLPVEKEE